MTIPKPKQLISKSIHAKQVGKFQIVGYRLGNQKQKKRKQLSNSCLRFFIVRAGRLELPRREALDPKSSMSTNSITPA